MCSQSCVDFRRPPKFLGPRRLLGRRMFGAGPVAVPPRKVFLQLVPARLSAHHSRHGLSPWPRAALLPREIQRTSAGALRPTVARADLDPAAPASAPQVWVDGAEQRPPARVPRPRPPAAATPLHARRRPDGCGHGRSSSPSRRAPSHPASPATPCSYHRASSVVLRRRPNSSAASESCDMS